jgi:hypothetical protein
MSTRSPCPSPPGGAVTCEGRQFAYCHIVAGKVESGCIPIPAMQATQPTVDTVLPVFQEVLASIGITDLYEREVVITSRADERSFPREFIAPGDHTLSQFLYRCMQEARLVVVLAQRPSIRFRKFRATELMIRFPSIWSRADGEPALVARPLIEI